MSQESYMALPDFDSLWRDPIKPWIQASITGFAMLMPALSSSTYTTISIIESPEFMAVMLDSEDKIIAGIRNDGSYVGLPIDEAIQAIVDVIDEINNA